MDGEDLSRIEAKLDVLIAIQRAAHAETLEQLAESMRREPVARAILRATRSWTSAGEIKRVVSTRARASKPTIERRVADLLERGLLVRRGSGPTVEYRSSGLVDL